MNWPACPDAPAVVATAISAFLASNLDDILLLLLLFSAARSRQAVWTVVAGQYLGFSLLVAASLIGFVGAQLLPPAWIGLLGLLPISLGVSQLIDTLAAAEDADEESDASPMQASLPSWLPHPCRRLGELAAITAITVANGGDNVGLYLPLFARCSAAQLGLTLLVFALLVALWCALAWSLLQTRAVAALVRRLARPAVPLVLIGLGLLILIDSHTLADRSLAVLVLGGLGVMAWSVGRQLQLLNLRMESATLD